MRGAKVRPPTAAELALAERVVADLGGGHVEIRVLCPRGHYVAHVGIAAAKELGGPAPLLMRARGPGKTFDTGFSHDGMAYDGIHSQNVTMTCRRRSCGYHGQFNSAKLALELAAFALAGNIEHRLMR